jgi:uncharacterized cupin superfamily protein
MQARSQKPPRNSIPILRCKFVSGQLAPRMAGRTKRPLGDPFGLAVYGVNLTRLAPGAWSMAHHKHKRQDELIYVLEGTPVLVTDAGETQLSPGMCAGFPAGGAAHHLENRGSSDAVILEVGDRTSGEEIVCPNDDVRQPWNRMEAGASSRSTVRRSSAALNLLVASDACSGSKFSDRG